MSIDRFVTNYKTLVIEYNKKHEIPLNNILCNDCTIINLRFEDVYKILKKYIYNVILEVKRLINNINFANKIILIGLILICFLLKSMGLLSPIIKKIIIKLNNEINSILYIVRNTITSRTSNAIWLIFQYIGEILINILFISGIFIYIIKIIKSIINLYKVIKYSVVKKQLKVNIVYKAFKQLTFNILKINFIIIILVIFLGENKINLTEFIVEKMFLVDLIVIILFVILKKYFKI